MGVAADIEAGKDSVQRGIGLFDALADDVMVFFGLCTGLSRQRLAIPVEFLIIGLGLNEEQA